MTEPQQYGITEGDRLFFRLSKSGKGVYVTNEKLPFGLRGNYEHVKAVMKGHKDFAVLEVRQKEVFRTPEQVDLEEELEEVW